MRRILLISTFILILIVFSSVLISCKSLCEDNCEDAYNSCTDTAYKLYSQGLYSEYIYNSEIAKCKDKWTQCDNECRATGD